MARAILSLMALANGLYHAVPAWSQDEGKALYNRHCAVCHQNSGAGSKGRVPPLVGSQWDTLGTTPAYPVTVILNGLEGEITVEGKRFDGSMPSFSGQLTDVQVAQVVNYLSYLQRRPSAPAATEQDVAAARPDKPNPRKSLTLRRSLLTSR